MEAEREAFLAAVRDNWNDYALRKIYADWLDERGESEEATRQRRWPEIVAESRKWLEDLAARMGGDRYGDMTYDRLMGAADRWVKTDDGEYGGDPLVQYGSEEWREDFGSNDELMADLWRHYEIVRGCRPKTTKSFFRCAC